MPGIFPSRRFLRMLFPFVAFLPTIAGALEPVRVVATGGRIGTTFLYPAGPHTSFRQRTPHRLGGPVAEIQVGFMDWMYTDKTETANNLNEVTISHAWLERDTSGQIVPLTFGGQRQLVLPMNSATPYWLSDAVPSTVWTGQTLARDEIFWLHVRGSVPTAGKLPTGTPATFSGSKFITYAPENDPGTIDQGGAVPTIAGSTSRIVGLPLIFLGRFTGPGHLSVIGIGDSIMDGTGDTANPVPVISGYGFFNRSALDANGANTIAMFNLTRHGQTANAWISPGKQQRQRPFLKFANVVAEEYGTNDLSSDGSGSPTAILARVEGIWTAARQEGVQKIVRTLLMPRTTSTSQWSNLADQTPNTGWGTGQNRDLINAGLIAARDAGKVDVILDTLAVLGDPTDPSRWLSNGTNKYVTSDGTHVSPGGNALLAPHLRSALLSLSVDTNRPDYTAWSSTIGWQGNDSSPSADPNDDGVTNLLAYALDFPPLGPVPPGALPAAAIDSDTAGGPWLTLTYRENLRSIDIIPIVESSPDMITWTPALPDGVDTVLETVSADVDSDGSAALRRMRLKQSPEETHRFMRLRVRY